MRLHEFQKDPSMPFDPKATAAVKTLYKGPKADERTGRHAPDKVTELNNAMRKLGWICNKTYGSYSMVFINPTKPYVLKVNTQPDYGFAWFAFLTHKYPNPHFPKIGNVKRITIAHHQYYMYMIEKLLPAKGYEDYANFIQDMSNNPEWDWQEVADDHGLLDSPHMTPELIQACRIIGQNQKKSGIDIHDDNIMLRSNGTNGSTIVITDPYVGPYFKPRNN